MARTAQADPIDSITWVEATSLRSNVYNPNRVLTPELLLLERSLLSTGWIQPVLANPDGVIIDGFHRWRLTQDSPAIAQRWAGKLPVATLDVDEPTAMAITVRINRAKGQHSAALMAALVQAIINDHGWTPERLGTEIGANPTEIDLLLTEGVFDHKNIDSWAYSAAWYPVPSDSPAAADGLTSSAPLPVERPEDPEEVPA